MSKPTSAESHQDAEIAITGMSGRFPGAANLDAFWRNLRNGIESISLHSCRELEQAGVEPELFNDLSYVPARGIIDGVELFDAAFFGFTPREAELTDPQHRLFLECVWEALEDAACDPERFPGLIGVFAGSRLSQYGLALLTTTRGRPGEALEAKIGNEKDFLPTQVSYRLNLTGPSVNVQTACSTSLVAVHVACQSLLAGECDLALAGGVAIAVPQKVGYLYQEGSIGSPDGHCRAFDARARGTVGGNGLGVVVLRRLPEALAAGDRVRAVVKGSAINNDGSGKVGYTAPSVDGQAAVIADALAAADAGSETISYVEAHGTGTRLGDPIEVAALTEAFRTALRAPRRAPCFLGSVKTNIGHLDPAAGVAGLIKTVLALEHGDIPPSLHFERVNSEIDLEADRFSVAAALQPWPRDKKAPRRAGVSSFGIGGTNAHVILEEAPARRPSGPARRHQLLVLSARSDAALEKRTTQLAAHLRERIVAAAHGGNAERELADLAFTLQLGRGVFEHRRMLVADHFEDARSALETLDPRRVFSRRQEAGERSVAFMFPGQGTQQVNMGRGLYEGEPVFRREMERAAEVLAPLVGCDLRQVLYPPPGEEEEAAARLRETAVAGPALCAFELALARLWSSWGVAPQALVGQSIGEYAAACLAGVFRLEDALCLVAQRGRLVASLPEGAMLTVAATAPEVEELLARSRARDLSLGAINGPALSTVSGPRAQIEVLAGELADQGRAYSRLQVAHAFHSAMMEPVLEPFAAVLHRIELGEPTVPFVSNLTGNWITAAEATDPSYWVRHLRQPVRFAAGVDLLLADPGTLFLEVGPGRGLSALVRRQAGAGADRVVVASLSRSRRQRSDVAQMLTALGQLWLAGYEVDWPALHGGQLRHRVQLPTYPFERRRYWREPSTPGVPSKRPELSDWTYVPSWRRLASPRPAAAEKAADPAPWLLLVDREGLGQQVAERLRGAGRAVITAAPGSAFARPERDHYTLSPTAREDYEALLSALADQRRIPARIVHLWTIGEGHSAPATTGFSSLLLLAQAWARQGWDHPLRLIVVASGVLEVTGEEKLSPEKATLLGPVRVLSQELPGAHCRMIDVVLGEGCRPEGLAAEICAAAPEPVVALRGHHRWAPGWAPVRLAGGPASARAGRLRAGGVYLITGGLGGLGMAVAEYLGRELGAKLILVARSPFPPPDEWPAWQESHGPDDEVSARIRRLQALVGAGAEVMVAAADVAVQHQMEAVVEEARERFGRIHGVIHAAGVPGRGLVQLKTEAETEAVFAPKIAGARVLEAIFSAPGAGTSDPPSQGLDFLVLFSSLNTVLGGVGMADDVAANAFLEAFALRNALAERTFTVAISWDAWQEVGMAAAAAQAAGSELAEHWRERLREGILPAEGVEIFRRVLAGTDRRVVVSTRDLDAVVAREAGWGLAELEREGPGPIHPRPGLTTAYAAPTTELERFIAECWQELLGFDRVGIHDSFFELGGHSLVATQFLSRLRRRSGVELSLPGFFEAATVAEVAAVVEADRHKLPAGEPALTGNEREAGRV